MINVALLLLCSQQDQVLVFPEGQLKAGGQREEKERQKKRPHRDTLAPENHFLPGVFFKPEEIDQEDGELTAREVNTNAACRYYQ